jgi:hypothetical protein
VRVYGLIAAWIVTVSAKGSGQGAPDPARWAKFIEGSGYTFWYDSTRLVLAPDGAIDVWYLMELPKEVSVGVGKAKREMDHALIDCNRKAYTIDHRSFYDKKGKTLIDRRPPNVYEESAEPDSFMELLITRVCHLKTQPAQ